MSNIIPHKPTRIGDLDDDVLNFVVEAYYNDELRDDNYEEFALRLNEMLKQRKDDKDFVESTRKLFAAVATTKEEPNNED